METLADFERAVWRACNDLFITDEEAHAAIAKERAERHNARYASNQTDNTEPKPEQGS